MKIRAVPKEEWFDLPADESGFGGDVLRRDAPDAHWRAHDENGALLCRASLWWANASTRALGGKRVGFVGHYATRDDESGDESAALLLPKVCDELRARGCALAIGPLDGDTSRAYRFVTENKLEENAPSEPSFFLEPRNPESWPQQFLRAGFSPVAHYTSALATDLTRRDPRAEKAWARLQNDGVRIRAFDAARADDELRRVHRVVVQSFARSFLFAPPSEEDFLQNHRALLPFVRPELALVAEQNGEIVGFCFALPDWEQARRGTDVNTAIIKTIAVLPRRALAGLGRVLAQRAHHAAHEAGYTRVVHALMHDGNASRNLSAWWGRPMRGYTLFGKTLDD